MMKMHVHLLLSAFLATLILMGLPAQADAAKDSPLAMDMSDHDVAITTSFVGSKLLLFGTTGGKGDVIVMVRGPKRDEVVRRKEKVAIIWVNNKKVVFNDIPSFYTVVSSRPLKDILSKKMLATHQIGLDHLKLEVGDADGMDAEAIDEFRRALIRRKQAKNLYLSRENDITFIKSGLFRLNVSLPANITAGDYEVDTILIRNGRITSLQSTKLPVHKVGFEAQVYNFAHDYGLGYGLLAVLIAIVAGWIASVAFRKG